MNTFPTIGLLLAWLASIASGWLIWQLLRQNGRLLLKLEDIEERLSTLEFNDERESNGSLAPGTERQAIGADRFSKHSVAGSKIKRDGLKAGTVAPEFRLPRLDGRGDLALSELRGRRLLLVFSSPGCGPCLMLAPTLETFHREHPELQMLMISKGEPKENRAKVREHGLTFPIVLQQQWEISRRYAMFATPVAYLIDEHGVIIHEVAIGIDAIVRLLAAHDGFDKPEAIIVGADKSGLELDLKA